MRLTKDLRFVEIKKVLEAYGYNFLRQRGSHRSYRNASGEMLVIVAKTPLKRVYVENILQRIGEGK